MKHIFLICIKNDGYEVSLEKRKLYEKVSDSVSEKSGLVRIIDESGDDYLYPQDFFLSVQLPLQVEQAIIEAA